MRRALLLLLLCVPTFFAFIGSAAITDSDEAYYAEASREMIESGDWITPRYNYAVRFEKPILFYWMIAATYEVAGVGEGQARFWAAMSGVGLVLLAYACGRRWFDDDAGFMAGAITATSFATAAMARQALPDLPLAFFVTLAVWAGLESVARSGDSGSKVSPRRWLLLSAAANALAALTKGPIGVALPVLILGSVMAFDYLRRPSNERRLPISARDLALSFVVFAAIAVPWYAAVTWVHGSGYLYRFFVAENLERIATPRYNDLRPIWFYVPIVIGGLLPWSTFALLWLRAPAGGRIRTILNSPAALRLALWAIVPLAIFSVSVGKQPRYILPCLVPLAILLGSSLARRVRATVGGPRDLALTAAGLLSGALLIAVGLLLYRAAPLVAAAEGRDTAPWALLVGAAAAAVVVASLRRSARALPVAVTIAAATTILAIQAAVMTVPGNEAVVRVAAAITREQAEAVDVCACGAFLRNLPFYTRRRTIPAGSQAQVDAALSSPGPIVAAIDMRKLADAEAKAYLSVDRLLEVPYLNTALLRIDDFVHPVPERAVQRVVVIRKR